MPFERVKPYNDLPFLPPKAELETKSVLKHAIQASRALAELKRAGRLLPNQIVLINNLVLLEAKDSSEIENIFTTHDNLYQADLFNERDTDSQTKEVTRYREALWNGANQMNKRLLGTNVFIEIVQTIKQNQSDVRAISGTQIVNPLGEIIYTPPEGEDRLRKLLFNLEAFIHNHDDDLDPLIKMAVIHYQFEAIHPFADGNGRTGRILNILYLLQEGLLETPVLFLSRYIIQNKTKYYKGLQNVTEHSSWEDWIVYMLEAVENTALHTVKKIEAILALMERFKIQMKEGMSNAYSKELLECLFENPFCRISTFEKRLGVSRQTASKYLHKLEELDLLSSFNIGKELVFLNGAFIKLLQE